MKYYYKWVTTILMGLLLVILLKEILLYATIGNATIDGLLLKERLLGAT